MLDSPSEILPLPAPVLADDDIDDEDDALARAIADEQQEMDAKVERNSDDQIGRAHV